MYTKKIFWISLFPSILLGGAYKYSYITNIRGILSDIIAFNAALFSFLIVFFTILLGIQTSDLFKRIEEFFINVKIGIFFQIKELLFSSLILFIYSLISKIIKVNLDKNIRLIGVFILFFLLFWVCGGILFIIKDMYNFVIAANKELKLNIKKSK